MQRSLRKQCYAASKAGIPAMAKKGLIAVRCAAAQERHDDVLFTSRTCTSGNQRASDVRAPA